MLKLTGRLKGLNLGQTMLENLLGELQKKAQATALILSESSSQPLLVLNELLLQSQIEEATLFNQDGKVIAFSSESNLALFPEMPSAMVLRHIRIQKPTVRLNLSRIRVCICAWLRLSMY